MTMKSPETQRRLSLYILPVLIGLGGIVYAQQLDAPVWRSIALLVSVALPLFAAGNLLARFRTSTLERFIMLSGVLMLILGAAFSVSDLSDSLAEIRYMDQSVVNASRIIGMLSLFLGLFVVLFSAVRTSEGIDEITERFRLLAEHISEGFLLTTPDGVIRLVNQKALNMFGMQREDVVGRNARDVASVLKIKNIAEQIEQRADGIASEYEVVVNTDNDERVFLINGAPVFNQQRQHTLTMATVRDVTEHRKLTRRVEESARNLQQLVEEQTRKLHRSEGRLRQLLLSMNEGFLTINLNHEIHFANAQAQALLKADEERLLGSSVFNFVAGADRHRLLNLFARAVEERAGTGLRQEIELVDGKGVGQPTVIGLAYLNAQETEDRGYSLVITPVADLKRMQRQLVLRARELEQANEELRQHDRAKDSFLSNVSHELRTPLTTIQGYIELFMENTLGEITESQRNALAVMQRNAAHLLMHINEMIEFSRMQIRGIQVVYDLYNAVALAREAVLAIHPAALEKEIAVHLDIPDAPRYCWGDRDKLRQVLGILLNNAVKFTKKGGEVVLHLSVKEGGDTVLSVRDTGIGIAQEHQKQIFTRFFQVDSSKTREHEGAGIGLTIAHNIVNAHNGEITVHSALGKGAVFTVLLPNTAFITDVARDTDAVNIESRILLIAENEACHEALASVLSPTEGPVLYAPSGYQAARQLPESKVDLIIINDAPADIAGEATLRVLRNQLESCPTQVIILTSKGGDTIRGIVQENAGLQFLFKPFTAEALVDRIREMRAGESTGVAVGTDAVYSTVKHKPFVVVLDSDPGFLEWTEMALLYYNIECHCSTSSGHGIEAARAVKPVAVFIDADTPPTLGAAAMEQFKADPAVSDVPIYAMTGTGAVALEKRNGNGIAGVLRKPFPITEMAEIIRSLMAE